MITVSQRRESNVPKTHQGRFSSSSTSFSPAFPFPLKEKEEACTSSIGMSSSLDILDELWGEIKRKVDVQEDASRTPGATRSLANYGKHRIGVLIFFLELKISEPYLQATINTKRRSDCFLSTTPEVRLIGQTRGVHSASSTHRCEFLWYVVVCWISSNVFLVRIMQIFVKTYAFYFLHRTSHGVG